MNIHEWLGIACLSMMGGVASLHIFRKETLFINQFCFFSIFFFSIIPVLERLNDVHYQANVSSDLFLKGSIFLGIFFATTIFFYCFWEFLSHKKNISKNFNFDLIYDFNQISTKKIVILFTFFTALVVLLFLDVGGIFFLYRENPEFIKDYYILNREFHEYLLKPLVFNTGLMFIIFFKSRMVKCFWLAVIMFVVFPTSIARFASASLYGSLVFLYLLNLRYFNKSFGLTVVLINIIGILFIFPIMDLFRRPTEVPVDFGFSRFIFSGHFDAFQNFCLSLELSPIFGSNILGATLFWIPRSVWQDKPIASNIHLSEHFNFSFNNISFSLPSEFFIAFGFSGLILGGFITGYFLFFLDKKWKFYFRSENLFFLAILLQSAQLLIYIMRGALLSSFAYTFGILFSWIIIYSLISSGKRS